MAQETGAAFARDLGYLDKFFGSLTAHAATLPQAQGDRLKQLIAEEVVRWKEIRQLIEGQGAPAPLPTAAPSATQPMRPTAMPVVTPMPPTPVSTSAQPPVPVGLTVGSLLGQPKK
jgi:hypothetical protein